MINGDRELIKRNIEYRLKQKGKKYTEKILDSLAEDYIEKQEFMKYSKVSDLPTKKQIKWWFQELPEKTHIENSDGTLYELYEVDIDAICIGNDVETKVFKYLYKWYWDNHENTKIPEEIEELIKIANVIKYSKNNYNKRTAKTRLVNIALIGTVRYYNKETKPYLSSEDIMKSYDYLLECLYFLHKVNKNKIEKEKLEMIKNKLYIFKTLD